MSILFWIIVGVGCLMLTLGTAWNLKREISKAPLVSTRATWRLLLLCGLLGSFCVALSLRMHDPSAWWLLGLLPAGFFFLLTLACLVFMTFQRMTRKRQCSEEFAHDVPERIESYWSDLALSGKYELDMACTTFLLPYSLQIPGPIVGIVAAVGWLIFPKLLPWMMILVAVVLFCAIAFLRVQHQITITPRGFHIQRQILSLKPWTREIAWKDIRFVTIGRNSRQATIKIVGRHLCLPMQSSTQRANWYEPLSEAILENFQTRPCLGDVVFTSAARTRRMHNPSFKQAQRARSIKRRATAPT